MEHERDGVYVDGAWRRPVGGRTDVLYSPADGRPFGTAPRCGAEDVDAAVAAARRALRSPAWAGLSPAERATLLERFADELAKDAEERAALTSVQNGMPITIARVAEGFAPVSIVRYHAALARSTPLEERRPRADGTGETLVRREPVGVVAAVVPWNFPQPLAMFKVAPALAAGCAVVLKPSPDAVLGALGIAAAADRAGLPPGVFNVVTGGADIGARLVAHPGVDRVAFTGSTETGRAVGAVCGRLLRPVTLQLSSRSPAIVLDDADTAATVRGLAHAALLNGGQACYLSTRILVPEHRHDELLGALGELADSLTVGDPMHPDTRVGPLVSRRHRDRVQSFIELGRTSGAVLAAGGGRPDADRGWYVQPTVFGRVDPTHPVAREEILGPVLTLVPYRDLDEAVALAEDSDYGLAGTVWTTDVERGVEVARRLRTGTVGVNFYDLDLGAPYGGLGASGLGHELGPEGLSTYFSYKSIYLSGN